MTSAYVRDKAAELVADGWVKILARHPDGRTVSRVGGYRTIRTARGTYRCDCAAACYGAETCSHREALRMALESS